MAGTKTSGALSGLASQLPIGRLKEEAQSFGQALTKQGLTKASGHVESMTGRLNDFAEGKSTATKAVANVAQGDSPLKAGVKATASKVKDTVKDKLGFGGGGGSNKVKVTNILESVDVPVSRDVAYEQWTQFEDFPTFMKKVENVTQDEDEKLKWKAQVFWSHRTWNAEIIDQVPNERIVWKSEGEKGHVDGAITFHELAPDLTRVLMALEYHPKGLFEHTGNLWRAQGRRARLELKHFARHVSIQTLLHQDELDGWKGEIHDGQVEEGESQTDEDQTDEDQTDEDQTDKDQSEEKESEEKPAARKRSASPAKKAPAKKAAAKKAPAKKTAENRAPAKRTAAAKQAPAKRTASKSTAAKKAPAKKTTSSSTAAKKTASSSTAAKKTTSSSTAAKKAPAKRAASRSSAAKKAPAKKAAAKKAPAKRTAAKKTSASKRPAKKSTSKAAAR